MKIKFINLMLICCLIFTGCNNKEEIETSSISLESTDTKYVVKIADNQYYIFYYENSEINDFEIWIFMEDELLRNNLYEDYLLLMNSDESVEEVKKIENYVVINYKEDYVVTEYNTNNINDIKDYYSTH